MNLKNKAVKSRRVRKAAFLAFLAICLVSAFCSSFVINSESKNESFLIFATDDRRELESHEKSNADMIMVVLLNRKKKTIKVVNLLRNIGVEDNSSGVLKTIRLKNAYRQGGPSRLQEQINRSFNLNTDSYVRINMQTIIEAIDSLGGIDVDLTAEEADYMNNFNPELTFSDPGRYLVSSPVHEGLNHMDGATTVVYGRCRNVGGEIARLDRFKIILNESIKKTATIDTEKASRLTRILVNAIETDMDLKRIVSLSSLAPDIENYKISCLSIPEGKKYHIEENGGDFVYAVNIEDEKKRISEFLSDG